MNPITAPNSQQSSTFLTHTQSVMAKRKRDNAPVGETGEKTKLTKKAKAPPSRNTPFKVGDGPVTIQIVAGSYDRVLHGITATIRPTTSTKKSKLAFPSSQDVDFADTFLFNAHASSIRCLALSPPSEPNSTQTQKVLLATGATDERVNVYSLSAHPPSSRSANDQKLLSSLTPRPILENHKNREVGALLHHTGNITRLAFPNRSKLLSASEDSTVAVTRSRDWALLHTFKCPVAKLQGRPSGDTAAHGAAPAGVNDFAVHPSNKIMISVSKGERCMRLWNLETGKKSRVLNFGRDALSECGEGKHSTGEARRIVWGSSGGEDEFAVGFDRDILVFGMDCKPRCRVMGDINTKIHEFSYIETGAGDETVLAVSTEDGRILLFSTDKEGLTAPRPPKENEKFPPTLSTAKLVAQLGGKEAGVVGRMKDFTVLPVENEEGQRLWYVVTGSSDGKLRVWQLQGGDIRVPGGDEKSRQVGKLLATYETQNRVTCVEAFIMIPRPEGVEESDYEFEDESDDDDSDSDDE
ncbi:WD40-repeat-containing domain protein [Podospora didyma]|uniref:WD40-repeat-containing domain protein n=1 Tax=Podospora didyma TaxID=330526 RepID=A0AAE0KE79_9PEZI|nr:WD40-repeat-containing domain protein [Podospora didyma]